MKACNPDLLRACAEGFATTNKNENLWSSNMWEAFEVGRYMTGKNMWPQHIYKSRGSSYVVNGHRFELTYKNGQPVKIEQVKKPIAVI
jgi:hypothetical protein